jgi:uncharacterized protein
MLLGLGLFTLLGFGGLGWLIHAVLQGRDLQTVFFPSHRGVAGQVAEGIGYGILASAVILWLLYRRILDQPRHYFVQLLERIQLGVPGILFLSLCAGIGEEWLFRGALQHWLGIWLCAVAFVALHGYLNPGDWPVALYGLLMVLVVAGMGYLYEYSGLFAAMSAHALIDVAIFTSLRYFPGPGVSQAQSRPGVPTNQPDSP